MSPRWRTFWRVFFMLEKRPTHGDESSRFQSWMLNRYPELKSIKPTTRDVQTVWTLVLGTLSTGALAATGAYILTLTVAHAFSMHILNPRPGVRQAANVVYEAIHTPDPLDGFFLVRVLVHFGILWGIGVLLMWFTFERRLTRWRIRSWLRKRGRGVCQCGYDTRGLTGDRCPECGRPIKRTA